MAAETRLRSNADAHAGSSATARSPRIVALRQAVGRLAPVLLVLAAAQILDLVTFAFAVDRWGIQGELGPLGMLYAHAGYWAVAAVKAATIVSVMLAMVLFRWQNPATPWRLGLIAAAIGTFGAATNVAALL
jgi:hypothetical protein